MKFNERELLTLREGLFSIRHNKNILSTDEFIGLDNKICRVITNNDSELKMEQEK